MQNHETEKSTLTHKYLLGIIRNFAELRTKCVKETRT